MEKILIAKILKPQGLKGQVKIKPYGNDFDIFEKGIILYLKNDQQLTIETMSIRGDFVYLTFEGFNSINDVEDLRGKEIFISSENIDDLQDDEYYVKDLLQCNIYDENNNLLGQIKNIDSFGSADVYTIKHKGKETLFAFVDGLFESVDLDNKIVIVNSKLFSEVMV